MSNNQNVKKGVLDIQSIPILASGGGLDITTSTALATSGVPHTFFTPITRDYLGIQGAISAAVAAGGAFVQLEPVRYDLTQGGTNTAAISLVAGIQIKGSGYALDNGTSPISGTILDGGNTVLAAFVHNSSDAGTQPTYPGLLSGLISNCGFSDLAVINCQYGAKIGALANPGMWHTRISNVYAYNCSQWGWWFENFQECVFDRVEDRHCGNGQAYLCSMANYNMGNSSAYHLFHEGNLTNYGRGIVIGSRNSSGIGAGNATLSGSCTMNDFNVYDIQGNVSGSRLSVAATMTTSSANITIPDASKFPIGMPVMFDSSVNGFRKWLPYFVKTCNTSTNVITVSDQMGRGNVLTSNGNTVVNIIGAGFPSVEHAAYDSASTLQECTIDGADIECVSITNFLLQGANARVGITTIGGVRGTIAALISSIGGTFTQLTCTQPLSIYVDQVSAPTTHLMGCHLYDDTGVHPFPGYFSPVGHFYSRARSSSVFSVNHKLGELNGSLAPVGSFGQVTPGNMCQLMPLVAIGQRTNYAPFTNLNLDDDRAGSIGYTGATNTTWTLPTLHDTPGTPNSNVGTIYEVSNDSTVGGVVLTLVSSSGQYFGRSGTKASYTIPVNGSITIRGAYDGTIWYWRIIAINSAT